MRPCIPPWIEFSPPSSSPSSFSPVVLKVWFPAQQHQHYRETCQRCRFLGPAPNLPNQKNRNSGGGAQQSAYNKPFRWFLIPQLENRYSVHPGLTRFGSNSPVLCRCPAIFLGVLTPFILPNSSFSWSYTLVSSY